MFDKINIRRAPPGAEGGARRLARDTLSSFAKKDVVKAWRQCPPFFTHQATNNFLPPRGF